VRIFNGNDLTTLPQQEQDFIFGQVYLKLLVLSDQTPADAFKKAQDDWEKFKRSSFKTLICHSFVAIISSRYSMTSSNVFLNITALSA